MTWDEVEPDLLIWTIPGGRAKNGVAHIVPLSQEAQAILRAAPRTASEGDNDRDRPRFVFPGRDGSFGGWSKGKLRSMT
jgi:integrase